VSPLLADLEVLAVDCQTTGANPEKGRLLEIAWSRGRAGDSGWASHPEVSSWLVRLPAGERIPRRITRITGIATRDLGRAIAPGEVWGRLRSVASGRSPGPRVTAVAHFARFELAFLEALQREHEPDRPFPFDMICTHEVACRMFPGLPRRSLRATAGFLGHVMVGEAKRAESHVRATIAVWAQLVARLRREHGVRTLEELSEWSRSVAPARRAGRDFAVARESRLGLPEAPGVYRMLARGGEVLYLGKASSLKRRVNSYFQHRRGLPESTREMLAQTFEIAVTKTASALEAALLESDEIKRHTPPYNVALRERRPEVWFASADDLRRVRPRRDSRHRIGPLPRPDALAPLAAMGRLLSGTLPPPGDRLWALALGQDRETRRREGRALQEGLDLFRARNLGAAHSGALDSFRTLLRLGARLWRRRLAEALEAGESPADGKPEAGPNDDPERLAAGFESTLMQTAHLVRRARWFGWLVESSLLWQTAEGRRRQLVIERGRVTAATDVEPASRRAPPPPGHGRSLDERFTGLDFRTYDRLRVLTTELKRIVARGAWIEIRFGPELGLDRSRLQRRLSWL